MAVFEETQNSIEKSFGHDLEGMDESRFETTSLSPRCSNKPMSEIEEEQFKQFDILLDPPYDHCHIKNQQSSKKKQCFQLGSKTVKLISKEWTILENDLPEQIFVRVYEKRMDLMRAVIVGSQDTPYQNGLFFFDIQFPANYPDRPPEVQYLSYGMQINPNLYENGRVCLSLLDTWYGKKSKSEKWVPGKSTVLQVLVSLQGLVLSAEPYFNVRPWPWTRYLTSSQRKKEYSLKLNKQVFELTCKTMFFVLQTPPTHFEYFISKHFLDHGDTIILNCMKFTVKNGHASLGDIFPKLVQALHNSNGGKYTTLLNHFAKKEATVKKETKVGFKKRPLRFFAFK